ncbi:MAG: histidine kinase [Spirochaetales bacterium]|nr:histidine kinase [Leptospiraceae bacterium]MCP5480975.1 histidine kinase [Spirochaetales bacterium]MCP5485355.1 histidine kinase [Spirochaetales bacterium]
MSDASGRTVIVDDLDGHYEDVRNRESILKAINTGQKLVFLTHVLSENMEHQLDFVIAALLKKYDQEHLQSTFYTCLKEIVINATKANAKEAYFKAEGLKIDQEEDYERGMARLRGAMNEAWIEKYGAAAKEMGLDVSITFEHNSDGVRVLVWSSPMKAREESRIRQKLAEGMRYDDIVAFYLANADQTEGEGIGLVMILLLLKAEHISPHLFRIGTVEQKTLARLEIPLSENFVSVRGADPAGHKK